MINDKSYIISYCNNKIIREGMSVWKHNVQPTPAWWSLVEELRSSVVLTVSSSQQTTHIITVLTLFPEPYLSLELRQVDVSVFVHVHHLHLHAGHLSAGWICAVSRLGDQTDLKQTEISC